MGDEEQGVEEATKLVDGQRDQTGRCGLGVSFSGGGHGQEGMREHGQGGPSVPGGPAADLVLVEPGEHVILVQAMPTPGAPWETASFKLEVKPCFTYYIVAVRENRILAAFTPRVDYAEPLGGCNPNPPAKK